MKRLTTAILASAVGLTLGATCANAADALTGSENFSQQEQIHAIGTAARADAQQLSEPLLRPTRLLDLAEAQIGASDAGGAQETLTQARALVNATMSMKVIFTVRVAKLFVAAGDPASGHALLDPRSLSKVEASLLLSEGAKALADVGDFGEASALAQQLAVRADVLAYIAARQCNARDDAGKALLASALSEARSADADRRSLLATGLAYGMAACGDVAGAIATINEWNSSARAQALSNVGHRLTRLGDFAAARAVVQARTEAYDYSGLMGLARDQIAWSDFSAARVTLMRAAAAAPVADTGFLAASPSFRVAAKEGVGISIFWTQLAAKAFEDATHAAEGFDRMNGPPSLIHVIEAEAKQHADSELERTFAVTIGRFGNLDDWPLAGVATRFLPSRTYYLSEVAATLARAGYTDKAKQALALAQKFLRRSTEALEGTDDIEEIAQAQAAMGDVDAALATISARTGRQADSSYRKIAAESAGRGDAKRALEIFGMIKQPNDSYRRDVAIRFGEVGDRVSALRLAQQMTRPDERFEVLFELLRAPGHATGQQ